MYKCGRILYESVWYWKPVLDKTLHILDQCAYTKDIFKRVESMNSNLCGTALKQENSDINKH